MPQPPKDTGMVEARIANITAKLTSDKVNAILKKSICVKNTVIAKAWIAKAKMEILKTFLKLDKNVTDMFNCSM